MKQILIVFLGFLSLTVQAGPLEKIMPFKWLHSEASHHASKVQPLGNEVYADFSGDWIGQCHVDDGCPDDEMPSTHLHIENNASWIKISDINGDSEEHEIGKDNSVHDSDKNGFFVSHWTFNWLNYSTLLFNFASIYNYQFPGFERSVNQGLARMTWTLVHDKLIIRAEGQYFENGEDAFHSTITCEYVRQ